MSPKLLHIPDLRDCLPVVASENTHPVFGGNQVIPAEALSVGPRAEAAAQQRCATVPYLGGLVGSVLRTAQATGTHCTVAEDLPSTAITTLFTQRYGMDLTEALAEGTGRYRLFFAIAPELNEAQTDFRLVYQVQPKPKHYSIGLFSLDLSARRSFVHMRDALIGPVVATGEGNVMKVPGVAHALRSDAALLRRTMFQAARSSAK